MPLYTNAEELITAVDALYEETGTDLGDDYEPWEWGDFAWQFDLIDGDFLAGIDHDVVRWSNRNREFTLVKDFPIALYATFEQMELYPNDRVRLFTKLLQEAFANGMDIPQLVH